MERAELKPCPFCGGKAKVKVCDPTGTRYTDVGVEWYMGREMTRCIIRCEKCGARTQVYATRRGVFNAWQRRAT